MLKERLLSVKWLILVETGFLNPNSDKHVTMETKITMMDAWDASRAQHLNVLSFLKLEDPSAISPSIADILIIPFNTFH